MPTDCPPRKIRHFDVENYLQDSLAPLRRCSMFCRWNYAHIEANYFTLNWVGIFFRN